MLPLLPQRKRKIFSGAANPAKAPPIDPPEKIIYTYGVDVLSSSTADHEEFPEGAAQWKDSIRAVERILNYSFENKSLLEEALTHPSYTDAPSYQRLEFVGDAALGLAISNYFYLYYPRLEAGQLSLLRAANISTEKLARVAVRHQLYKYVRHNAAALSDKVGEFVCAVEEEDETVVHGGPMKAPKVLADIVESVAAAVYVDCKFNLEKLWMVFGGLLEPLVMLDVLEKQPQPVTMLFESCQKDGKHVDIKHWRKGEKNIASVYVDGTFVASGSSEHKENAKLHAAEAALYKLESSESNKAAGTNIFGDGTSEIDGAKQKLYEMCNKKRWPKPTYRVEDELGPAHEKRYICSVRLEVSDCIFNVSGDERSRVKDAKNSAASFMLRTLRESNYL